MTLAFCKRLWYNASCTGRCDGIGRRSGFKIRRANPPCGFESHHRHHESPQSMIQSTEDFLILPMKSLEIKGIAGHCRCRGLPVSRFFVLRGLNAGERNWEFEPSPYPTGGKIKRLGKSLKGCHSIHWSLSRSWRVFPSWVFQEVQPFALFPTTNIAAPDGLARRTSSSRT